MYGIQQVRWVMRRLAKRGVWPWAVLAGLAVSVAVGAAVWAADAAPAAQAPARWTPSEQPNQPLGEAKGIHPGRVVWMHDPKVAQWDGDTKKGGWYEDKVTDPARAANMLSQSLRLLTGEKSDAGAWAALFRHYNRTHGRGDAGYKPGEKVAIKLNLNCSKRRADPTLGYFNSPQLTVALMRQLVNQARVRPADIVVFDASRWVNDTIYLPIHAEFPDIRFEDREGGEGREKIQPDKTVALHFGDPATPDSGKTYLPTCITGATYMINAAVLKGHVLAGVTLCAKNHFGSVYRENIGPSDPHQGWNPSNLHESILVRDRAMGTYNSLVDLMGHKDLGGKTILYLIDGLYAAPHQNQGPERWQSPPFGGHWTASLFVSQDPVAIESVAVDFAAAEKTAIRMVGAVDNYLHEAALAGSPPSKTRYDPEGDGTPLGSLGVHEHWNNPEKRQYSRNLGSGKGIELVTKDTRPAIALQEDEISGLRIRIEGRRPWTTGYDSKGGPLETAGFGQEAEIGEIRIFVRCAEFQTSDEAHRAVEFTLRDMAEVLKEGLWAGAQHKAVGDESWFGRSEEHTSILLRSGRVCALVGCVKGTPEKRSQVTEILAKRITDKASSSR